MKLLTVLSAGHRPLCKVVALCKAGGTFVSVSIRSSVQALSAYVSMGELVKLGLDPAILEAGTLGLPPYRAVICMPYVAGAIS